MPIYNYECNECRKKKEEEVSRKLTMDEILENCIFETSHAMNPTDEELKEAMICPRCESINTEKTLKFSNAVTYIRGNGYLDKRGCHRDMNLHKLETDDPYKEYRETGEVDDLKAKISRAGKHDPKPKHFTT